jgi:hypothetical protein
VSRIRYTCATPRTYWLHVAVLPVVLGSLLLLSYRSGRPRAVPVRRVDPLLPFTGVTWVFRVLVLTGPVLAFALTRMICHMTEACRQDEAEHGIETGRIVMSPEGGFTEIREKVASG